MTFYDEEEIEENENPEEGQSEENELEEAEQEENNAGSDEVGAKEQYDGIDNLSSRGTMGSNRQRHGSRQRQINKARNMMNKGKNVAQRGKQAGKKMASGAKGQASKKAAEEGVKKAATTAAKAGAKAGASTASAGAGVAAGGAGAAMGPCCGIVLLIAIIIFLLIGIVGFFQNMPDMILGKIYEWFDTVAGTTKIVFGADPAGVIADANLEDAANYVSDMGYDLTGYGFLAKRETEEDIQNNVQKKESYYTFIFRNMDQANHIVQYNGDIVWTSSLKEKHIGLGETIDEQVAIIENARDTILWLWEKVGTGEITVRRVEYMDANGQRIGEPEYKRVLEREITFDEADVDERGLITNYEVGEVKWIDSEFLRAYLMSDYRTYMFYDGKSMNWFDRVIAGLTSDEALYTESANGLINIDTKIVESVEGDNEEDNIENYDGDIHLVRGEKKLYISPGKEVEEYEPDYIYDLNGWAGKYGKPLEFSLTLHLATMSPDFTYAVAIGDERLATKVNIKFYQTKYSRRLLKDGQDAEEYYYNIIVEKKNRIENMIKTFEKLINITNNATTMTEEEKDEWRQVHAEYFSNKVSMTVEVTDLEESNQFCENLYEILDNVDDFLASVEKDEYTPSSNPGYSDVEELSTDFFENIYEDMQKLNSVIWYNSEHANLSLYIPYIKSVDDHWYRDLDFKDPEAMQGYIVKIDEPGAAPYVENIDDLKKILATYSDAQGASNLVGAADAFMQIQNEYGINALFAASVAIKESGAGTSWDLIDSSTHNWMSTQGSRGGGYKDKNGTTWNRFSSFSEATLAFGELISGESSGNYFGKGYYSVGDIAIKGKYCVPPEGWIKGVCNQMETFLNRAVDELGITLINEENIDSGLDNLQGTQNSGDQSAYEVVSGSSAEVGLTDGELDEYNLDSGEGYTVLRTQAEDLRQVREPIQYDNSAVIKELLGVVDTRIIKKYTDGETVDVENEDQLAVFEAKVAEKAKYYIYNGTGMNEGEKRQISPTKNSLTAMSILESTKTEDAEHLLKNLRELFNDIGFELEDSSEEQATKYEKNTSLQWIFQRYIPSYEWPSQEETPKTEDNEEGSRYIYKVTAKREGDTENTTNTDEDTDDSSINDATDDTTDTNSPTTGTDDTTDTEDAEETEETVYGFEGGDILVAPGNCVIKKIGEDYLTIQFRNVIKHEIYTKRTWNGSEYVMTEISTKDMTETELEEYKAKKREELGLSDDIDPLWDPEVNGTTLTIFGLEVDSNLKVDDTTIIEAGTQIGKTKKGVDIGLLLRGQDLTASDADNEDATENIPSEEDENEDGEKKLAYLSVPRYIYPPEKTEVIFDMSKLQGLALEVWNDYSAEITEMAIRYGLDPYAIVAVICVESSGRLDSDNGIAYGLMQCHMKYHAVPNKTLVDVDGNRVVKDCSPSAMRGNASLQIECGCHVVRSYIFYPWPDGNWFKGLGSYNKGPSGIKNPSTLEDFRNGYWQKFKKYFWGGDETWAIKREGNSYYQIFTNVNTGEISGTVEVAWPPTGSNTLLNGDILEVAKQLHDYVRDNRFTYGSHYNIKDLGSGTESKVIDCSAYVSWVLYELGYQEFGTQKSSSWFKSNGQKLCDKYGWQMITPVNSSTLQPGDILVVYESGGSHHVEIYAGNGRSYSCGSNSSIRADTISTNFSKYNFALRVTGRGGN